MQRLSGTHPRQQCNLDIGEILGFTELEDWRYSIFKKNRISIALALLETFTTMHDHQGGWLHNDLHAQNILLHFPLWDWNENGVRTRVVKTSLVFVGIYDFGLSHPTKFNLEGGAPHHSNWKFKKGGVVVHCHIAPKLNNKYTFWVDQP